MNYRMTFDQLVKTFDYKIKSTILNPDHIVYGSNLRSVYFENTHATFNCKTGQVFDISVQSKIHGRIFWVDTDYEVQMREHLLDVNEQSYCVESMLVIALAVENFQQYDADLLNDIELSLDDALLAELDAIAESKDISRDALIEDLINKAVRSNTFGNLIKG
jgi:hypothetical protein